MTPEQRVTRLVTDSAPALLGYLVRRCDPPADAADLLSDVYVVLWRRRHDLPEDPQQCLAFAFGTARGVLANGRRARRRHDDLSKRLAAALPTTASHTDPTEATLLRHLLVDLPDRDRQVLLLAGVDDLAPGEIAALLGISTPAVRQRLHRARLHLRLMLDGASTI